MTNETTDARYDALIIEAQKLGREAGQNAAGWWAQDAIAEQWVRDAIGGRSPLSGARLRSAARRIHKAWEDAASEAFADAVLESLKSAATA
jgi:hypothetical protein